MRCTRSKFLSFIDEQRCISGSYKYWCREESYFVIRRRKTLFSSALFVIITVVLCAGGIIDQLSTSSSILFYSLVIVFCSRRLTSHTTSSRRSSFSSFTVRAEVRSRVSSCSAGTAPATQLGGGGSHFFSGRIRGQWIPVGLEGRHQSWRCIRR